MANRIVRSRIPSGRSKRSTTWSICSVPTGMSNLAAATKSLAISVPSTTLLDLIPFTITRTVGKVAISSDQLAATEEQIGAFGFGLINDVAGAIGVSGIPGPATNCGWPGWFVHQFFSRRLAIVTAIGSLIDTTEYVFDSRAMRKIEAEQDLVFVVENFHATAGLRFAASFRMLIKAG